PAEPKSPAVAGAAESEAASAELLAPVAAGAATVSPVGAPSKRGSSPLT
ncbi:hypothetical protein LCGC14_0928260, partial [marine sediment metagenome]